MDENNSQTNSEASKQYQEILNKYAATLNNQQAITPPSPSPPVPTAPPEPPKPPQALPLASLSPPPIRIITPDPLPSPPPPTNNIFKYFFLISLLTFLSVFSAIIYTFVQEQKSSSSSSNLPSPTSTQPSPTTSPSACELNDKKYNVGASFTAADGCNSCTCLEDLIITCTEKDCSSSDASSTIPADWKTYENKKYNFSIQHPSILIFKETNNLVSLPIAGIQVKKNGKDYINIHEEESYKGNLQDWLKEYSQIQTSEITIGNNKFYFLDHGAVDGSDYWYITANPNHLIVVATGKISTTTDTELKQILSTFKFL